MVLVHALKVHCKQFFSSHLGLEVCRKACRPHSSLLCAKHRAHSIRQVADTQAGNRDYKVSTRCHHCHAGGASSSGREHVFQPDPDAKPLFPSSYKGGKIASLPHLCALGAACSLTFRLSGQPCQSTGSLSSVFLAHDSFKCVLSERCGN